MSTSHFYHTQGIRGFKLKRLERAGGVEIACMESSASHVTCPACGAWDTRIVQTNRTRDIRGLSIGLKRMVFWFSVRRVRCGKCNAFSQEPLSCCTGPYSRITRHLGYYVLALRTAMSISDVARFTGLHWDTVKNIESDWLAKKYRKVGIGNARILGIDEVYLEPVPI